MTSPYHAHSETAANRVLTTLVRGRRAFAAPARRSVPLLAELESRRLLSNVTVASNADSGPGSLRAAIESAVPGEVITFASSLRGQTIVLASPLVVSTSLTVRGIAGGPTISGNGSTEVFTISSGVSVSLTTLTIANGNSAREERSITPATSPSSRAS